MQFFLAPMAGAGLLGAMAQPLLWSMALTPDAVLAQVCSPQGAFAAPSEDTRTVEIPSLQGTIDIPSNYDIAYTHSGITVTPPIPPEMASCLLPVNTGQGGQLGQIQVSWVATAPSEPQIREQLANSGGRFWGETQLPSGPALMYTTADARVHISLPTPDQQAAIVFTADMDSNGDIVRENVYETILESFEFE